MRQSNSKSKKLQQIKTAKENNKETDKSTHQQQNKNVQVQINLKRHNRDVGKRAYG